MRRVLLALSLWCITTSTFAAPAFKGMSYTSFNATDLGSATSDQSLAIMKTLGVDTVALNFWWYQTDVHQNTMAPAANSSTVASVQHAIDTIHSLGMKVFLKPMLDVSDGAGTWRAYINPTQPDTWFGYNASNPFASASTAPLSGSYGAFIDTFADIAQSKGVEMLSIGCELNNMENPSNDQHWKDLIDNVRTHYSGPLTYSANWSTAGTSPVDGITVNGGYNNIGWWNKFDAARGDEVGVDAYFPIGSSTSTLAQLQSSWTTTANTIDNWRTTAGVTDKRLLFTETGYASYDGTAASPYASAPNGAAVDEQEQADAYQAQLNVMSTKSWWDGAMWWNWETSPNSDTATSYSPQNKLVQDVLASNYGGTVPALSLSNWSTASSTASFSTSGNWTDGAPNLNFVAQFSRGAAATYTVTFSNNPTVDQLRVGSNTVTFQPSTTTTSRTLTADDWHTNTASRAIIIGVGSGDTAVVNLARNGSANMTLSGRAATIGDAAGATGTLTVTNATLNVIGSSADAELIIGRLGTGNLTVQNGGKVNVSGANGDATIGQSAGGIGVVTITGSGSAWTTTGVVRVGQAGQGTLIVASSGTVTANVVSIGSVGTLHGDGTIVGSVQNSGIVGPGTLPGSLHINGSFSQTSIGELQIELGGTMAGTQYDQLFATNMTLNGALTISLINGFSPTVGNAFSILQSGSAPTNTFTTINLPALGSFLAWDQSQLYSAGVLSVISVLPGDFNRDGIVDAADYTVWRDTFGQTVAAGTGADSDGNGIVDQADYDNWALDFGTTVGSLPGAGSAAAVPEPPAFRLAIFAIGLLYLGGRASSHR